MGERSARGQTLDILRSGAFMDVPSPPEGCLPLPSEALQFIEDIRKPRFAAFANVIDLILERTLARGEASIVHHTAGRKLAPWEQLSADIEATINEEVTAVEDTEAFRVAEAYAQLVGRLDARKRITLNDYPFGQLNSGAATSSTTMTHTLRNFPELIATLGGGPDLDHVAVARNSVVLPSRMAMTSVNQMMGVREVVNDPKTGEYWGNAHSKLDASKYVLTPTSNGSAIVNYADFESMEVPAGWTPSKDRVDPVSEATAIRDIPTGHDEVIGCPITLLRKRMLQKWHWVIDLSVGRELWVPASAS